MTSIHVSPGGIGYVRPTVTKTIPGQPDASKSARRRSWLRRDVNTGRYTLPAATEPRGK